MDRDVDFVKMVFTAEPPVFNVTKQKQHLEVPPFARQPCYRILAEDLGQWLCVPPFRMVCPFQTYRNVIQNVRLVSRNFFFSLSQAQVPVLDSLFVHCIRLSNNSFTFFLAV